jgi:hypothetical protein
VIPEPTSFEGHACVRLCGAASEAIVTTSVGPRILGLLVGGDNVLAVLPGAAIARPDGEPLRLLGGHRLWAAPEVPRITYAPDVAPCTTIATDDGVRVEAPADDAGLTKTIDVRPTGDGWIVDHEIRNTADAPIALAPWAITQFPLGGVVVAPASTDATGPQADRSLVLWPYTDPADPRLRLLRDELRVDASSGPRLKVGLAPGRGRVAYERAGLRFEKEAVVDPDASYPDRGAAIQVFVGDGFCELETLGPLRALTPGDVAQHRERWIVGRAR